MRILIVTTVLCLNLFGVEINWSHDYNATMKLAQKEHKNVYLFIGADKCRFCVMFKKNALDDKATLARLKKSFIPLYLSRDRHYIPKQFERFGAPRHYFLRPDGTIIYKDWGVRDANGFNLMLDEVELSQ